LHSDTKFGESRRPDHTGYGFGSPWFNTVTTTVAQAVKISGMHYTRRKVWSAKVAKNLNLFEIGDFSEISSSPTLPPWDLKFGSPIAGPKIPYHKKFGGPLTHTFGDIGGQIFSFPKTNSEPLR